MIGRAAIVVLVGALALAGCGGKEKEKPRLSHAQYERELHAAYGSVREAFRQTRVGSLSELDPKLGAAQAQLRHAAEELESGEPPRDVAHEHEELVEGLREYAEELDEVREAARDGNQQRVAEFNANVGKNEAVEQIAESLEEINHRGYDLGDIKLD
ncbi:MAG TPA: hypothetical protein VF257_05390 [Solirubrobacteraceae bacterium]